MSLIPLQQQKTHEGYITSSKIINYLKTVKKKAGAKEFETVTGLKKEAIFYQIKKLRTANMIQRTGYRLDTGGKAILWSLTKNYDKTDFYQKVLDALEEDEKNE